jgi:hypothetical protein
MMQQIRDYYKVPAKRGMRVRYIEGFEGQITRSHGMHIGFRSDNSGKVFRVHPYELDYWHDGEWVIGKVLQKQHDDIWDRFNSGGKQHEV